MLTGTTGSPDRASDPHDEKTVGASDGNGGDIRILLVGGSRLLQESVVHLLDDTKFTVQKCVAGVEHAIPALNEQPGLYDLILVQLFGNSEVRFFDGIAQLKVAAGDRRLVLLAWPVKDLAFLSSSFEAGVDAYLESSMSQEGFRQSLDLVICGEQIFPSRMSPVLKSGGAAMAPPSNAAYQAAVSPGPGTQLSTRETEILRHLANGEPNKVIANELTITEATVKVHVKGILRKIGAANRTQAAIWAIHNGVTPVFSIGEGQRQ